MNKKMLTLLVVCLHTQSILCMHDVRWIAEKMTAANKPKCFTAGAQKKLRKLALSLPSPIQRLIMGYFGKYTVAQMARWNYIYHCSTDKQRYLEANNPGCGILHLPSISRLSFNEGSFSGEILLPDGTWAKPTDSLAVTAEFGTHEDQDKRLQVQYSVPHQIVIRDENDMVRESRPAYVAHIQRKNVWDALVPNEAPYAISPDCQFMAYVSNFKEKSGGVEVCVLQCVDDPVYKELGTVFDLPDTQEAHAFSAHYFAETLATIKKLTSERDSKKACADNKEIS